MQTNNAQRFLKGLWLIPLLVLAYVGWMNVMPLGATVSYYIDVGGEDTTGKAKFTGPFDGISDKKDMSGTSFRLLEKSQVYIELESSLLRNASEIDMNVRFRDEFPNDGKLLVGARNNPGSSYLWKEAYIPFYKKLTDLPLVAMNESIQVYATEHDIKNDFQSVDDFLQNLPFGSVVATNDRDLKLNQRVSQEELGEMDSSEFAAIDVPRILLASDASNGNYMDSHTSLRGSHNFYFFTPGGTFELTVTKLDLNRYEGEDKLAVTVYSLDGTIEATITIDDDGDTTKSNHLGYPQPKTLKADHLEMGVYHLALKSPAGYNDFVISRLQLNQNKLIIPKKVFLAGNLYLGGDPRPMTVWGYLISDGEIKLSIPHNSALQKVFISGEGYYQTVIIDAVNTGFSTGLLKAGIYQITLEKGDATIEAPSGNFALTGNSIFTSISGSNGIRNNHLVINTSLRGGHTLWTNVSNGFLDFKINKQDLNWYENSDELAIEVHSLTGELIANAIIPDDGDESQEKKIGPVQSASLSIENVESGAYRIELKGSGDMLIRKMEINQDKLVIEKKAWVIGMNSGYFDHGTDFDPVTLYGKNFRAGEVTFFTYHDSGLQQVSIISEGFNGKVEINKVNTDFSSGLKPGPYSLTFPKQNMLLEFDGFLSFTPGSFFLPKRVEVIDLKYDMSWDREHADYFVVNSEDYMEPINENDGWLVTRISWKKENLFIEDNKLSFCLSVPHLDREQERTIPVENIEIKVKILPIYKRLSG